MTHRGNKTSVHTRAKRKARVIELTQAGATKQEIATEVGISRQTLWRYLQALDVQFVESNRDAITALKQKVAGEIAQRADEVLDGELDPKRATAWNNLMSSFNRLLGLNAPTKSINAHISANHPLPDYGPAAHPRLWKIHEACVDLSDDQIAEVVKFAKSIRRVSVVTNPYRLPEWMVPAVEGNVDDN